MGNRTSISPYIPLAAIFVAAGVLLLVLTSEDSPSDPQQLVLRVLSPAKAHALGLTLELHAQIHGESGWELQSLSVTDGEPATAPAVLHEGDRLRLALATDPPAGAYVYAVSPADEVVRIPDVAARPLRARRGEVLRVPPGDGWFEAGPPYGEWSVLIVASRERHGDLEDMDLRYRQSTGPLRRALADSLRTELRGNAVAQASYMVQE